MSLCIGTGKHMAAEAETAGHGAKPLPRAGSWHRGQGGKQPQAQGPTCTEAGPPEHREGRDLRALVCAQQA